MPQLTLQFDLPEEQEESNIAIHAGKTFSFIEDFENWLRRKYKHEDFDNTKLAEFEYEEILEKWYEMKNDNDVRFY